MRTLVVMLVMLAALAPRAHAGKPTIAILTLEPIGEDREIVRFAEDITDVLRARAKAGVGSFAVAPGSDKSLIEMKLLTACENEDHKCMAAIGTMLAADYLMYGRVERRGATYQVSLKLLNVAAKSSERSTSNAIPVADASGAKLSAWSKTLYAKVTGVQTSGSLSIKANVDAGTVLIDGEERAALVDGRARIADVPDGKYQIAIEADGHRRYESIVDIIAGEETSLEVELDASGEVNADHKADHKPAATAGGCAHCATTDTGGPTAWLTIGIVALVLRRRSPVDPAKRK